MQEKIQIKAISLYNLQQKLFWALIAGLSVVVAFYMFFVGKTIINVVDRRTSENEIKNLNSVISELESRYIALGQDINLADAETMGFHEVTKIEYVSRDTALTMRDHVR